MFILVFLYTEWLYENSRFEQIALAAVISNPIFSSFESNSKRYLFSSLSLLFHSVSLCLLKETHMFPVPYLFELSESVVSSKLS